jgi:putative heme iron utilization protein
MQTGEEQAYTARQLWAGAFHATISTQSLDQPGYPFGSVVPYVLDRDGRPLLLLSHLSQHTKNLDADSRCSFLVAEPGPGDIQQLGRLNAIGDTYRVVEPDVADIDRYLGHFPQARMYFEQLGFRFYRFSAIRLHWNGGFATARWFDPARIMQRNPLDSSTEKSIIDHMNADHADALRTYLDAPTEETRDMPVTLAGVDGEGMALRVADRLLRVLFPRPIESARDVRSVLIEMLRGAAD